MTNIKLSALFYRIVFIFLVIIEFLWGFYKFFFKDMLPSDSISSRVIIISSSILFIYGTFFEKWFFKYGTKIISLFCFIIGFQLWHELYYDSFNQMSQSVSILSIIIMTLLIPNKKTLITFTIAINISYAFIPQNNFFLSAMLFTFSFFAAIFKYYMLTIIEKLDETYTKLQRETKIATIGEFAKTMSHEINNQVTKISLYGQSLLQNHKLEKHDDSIDKINNLLSESYKISNIIKELKQFSSLEKLEKENISIHDLNSIMIKRFSKQINTEIPNFNFRINNKLKKNYNIYLNKNLFLKVVENIIENALFEVVKTNPKTLYMEITEDEKNIFFNVVNSGQKIPKHIESKIFDSFFSTKDISKGKGIGLSLAQKIIQEHNGKIFLNQEKENLTTFSIKIPK